MEIPRDYFKIFTLDSFERKTAQILNLLLFDLHKFAQVWAGFFNTKAKIRLSIKTSLLDWSFKKRLQFLWSELVW